MKRQQSEPKSSRKPLRLSFLMVLLVLSPAVLSRALAAVQPFHAVDLSAVYATSFSNAPEAMPFPRDDQRFDGIPFHIGGRIELTGMEAASHGEFSPKEVTGIRIGQTARRLHLLTGALHGQRDGIPLANVVLHFKSGETQVFRLAFGVHTRNSIEENAVNRGEIADPNSRPVWQTTNAPFTRLYKTSFDNPRPEQEISSIDFVSLFGGATPLVFALTLQDGSPLSPLVPLPKSKIVQRATEFKDSAYRRDLTVRVTDSSGQALPEATALLTLQDDSTAFFFGQHKADARGEIVVPYPPQHAVALSVRFSHPRLAAKMMTFSGAGSNAWPEALSVQLQNGSLIGGAVADSTGRPLSNVVITPFVIARTASNRFVRTDLAIAQTGADGRWQANAVTDSLTNLSVQIAHPEYRPTTVELPLAMLLAADTLVSLQPHVIVAGRIVDENGEPIARAAVTLNDADDVRHKRTSDQNGRFRFVVAEPSEEGGTVFVMATNHAPASQAVALDKTTRSLDFVLEPGAPFTMRIVNSSEAPVPGVNVKLYRWNETDVLQWSAQTDRDGRFQWDHAPRGQVMFRFEKTNYTMAYHSVSLPMAGEPTFTYNPPLRILARVLDAATRKPIDQFRARLNYSYQNGSGSSTSTGRRGSLNMSLGGLSAARYTSITLLLESPGYEPLSVALPSEPTGSTNEFQLKKAKMLEGVVLAPNGTPAPHVEIVLLDRRANASMEDPGKFRRTSSLYEVVVADEEGRFALTPKVDADIVFASHRKLGWAEVPFGEFEKGGKIQLARWGYVKGVLKVGEKVEPYHYITLQNGSFSPPTTGHVGTALFLYYKVQPEPDGHFFINAVPPGERKVSLRYSFSDKETGSWRLSHGVPITVKAGETNDIVIGGEGRTVLGKVEVKGLAGPRVDWRRGNFTMDLLVELPSGNPPRIQFPPQSTAAERQKINEDYQKEWRAWSEARSRQSQLRQRTYAPVFEQDGSFQIPNVPPGTYTLNIAPYDPRQPSSSRTLATLNRRVVVPDGQAPHDLGTFELTVTR